MYKALYLSPMIPSYDIQATGTFFKDILGFTPLMNTDNYTILSKDNLTIHILRAGNNIGQMEFYLEVDNIEEVWKNIETKVTQLKVIKPFDREYGMREIHIAVPCTQTLLFIGQEISVK